MTAEISVSIPAETLEAIAERAAELVLERLQGDVVGGPELLTVKEAATFLRAEPQRVYDLLSQGRLRRCRDGGRVLVRRVDLVAYVAGDEASSLLEQRRRRRVA